MRYYDRLDPAGLALPEGRREYSYGNALAEFLIGLFKTEVIQHWRPWRHGEAVGFAALAWLNGSNSRRLLEPIGSVPQKEVPALILDLCRLPPRTGRHGPSQLEELTFGRIR